MTNVWISRHLSTAHCKYEKPMDQTNSRGVTASILFEPQRQHTLSRNQEEHSRVVAIPYSLQAAKKQSATRTASFRRSLNGKLQSLLQQLHPARTDEDFQH